MSNKEKLIPDDDNEDKNNNGCQFDPAREISVLLGTKDTNITSPFDVIHQTTYLEQCLRPTPLSSRSPSPPHSVPTCSSRPASPIEPKEELEDEFNVDDEVIINDDIIANDNEHTKDDTPKEVNELEETAGSVKVSRCFKKMDMPKAFQVMGFTNGRSGLGDDPDESLRIALSKKMKELELRQKRAVMRGKSNQYSEQRARNDLCTLHEAYQFLSRKCAMRTLMAQEAMAASSNPLDRRDSKELSKKLSLENSETMNLQEKQ